MDEPHASGWHARGDGRIGWAHLRWSTGAFSSRAYVCPCLNDPMEPTVVGCGTGHRAQEKHIRANRGARLGAWLGLESCTGLNPLGHWWSTHLEKLSSKIGNGLRASCRWRMRRWMFDRSNRGSRTRKASAPCRGCCRLRFLLCRNHHARGCTFKEGVRLRSTHEAPAASLARELHPARCHRPRRRGVSVCLPWRAVALPRRPAQEAPFAQTR